MVRRVGATLAAVAVAAAIAVVTTSAQQGRGGGGQPFAPGELLVKYRPSASTSSRNAILAGQGASLVRRFRTLDSDLVRLPPGRSVAAAVAAFRAVPDVLLAQPNYIRRAVASAPPNDPYWLFGFQWNLEQIQAQAAWTSFTTGDPNVVVASLDTGVNYTHPDLAPNMWHNPGEIPGNGIDDDGNGYVDDVYGIDTVNHDSDPMDDNGHGTHTAGIIGANGNDGVGVVGVNWRTSILACKFINASGYGTDADAVECFDYLVSLRQRGINVRVTNNSWGASREGSPATVLQDAIDAAGAAGILNVFAAGNDGTNNDLSPFDPASFDSPSIITVAASDASDDRASFSNYGVNSVDLAAPGDTILSTYQDSYAFASGTSMAAPHVAGAAALVLAQNPALSVDQLKAILMQSVDVLPQWASFVGSGGRLNLLTALQESGGNLLPQVALTSPTNESTFTESTPIAVLATASDPDGSIARVDFYANGTLVGSNLVGPNPYTVTWTPVTAGTYSLTAVATDDAGGTRQSPPVAVTITPPSGEVNVALASNGGSASASSEYGAGYPASAVNNGDRRGEGWGSGGGWADGTDNAWPDWVQVAFNGPQTIEEIDVFTVQDDYANPTDPTPNMTFSQWGIVDFTVQYWTGTAWAPVPGGAVTGNTNVWRQFYFAPVTTARIRVLVSSGLQWNSRVTEVEAYAVLGTENAPPAVALTSPTSGTSVPSGNSVDLAATATDSDGAISQVSFYANGVLVDTDTTGPAYSAVWVPAAAGTYDLTAVATDDRGATATSAPVTITVEPPPDRVNVALAVNGGTASASSEYGSGYPASAVNDGDRRGVNWGNGGGWADGTADTWPDWVQVAFNGAQSIEEIDVFTVQDDTTNPGDPTPGMTFTRWGIVDFTVQYWTGTAWAAVPGGVVTGNTNVWRQFSFAAVTTSRIRVQVSNGLSSYSRVTEVEAYAVPGPANAPPTVALTSPATGTTVQSGSNVDLVAAASDSDGTVSQVDFYASGALVATDATGPEPFTAVWTPPAAGTYELTAVATDDDGATTTSALVSVTVEPPPGLVNVALAASGGTASASSVYSSSYPASAVNNGDRRGVNWGSGGGWADGTADTWPDWVEVAFSSAQPVQEIDVFTVQDNTNHPSEPTPSMTFSKWGIVDFTVQYWTGAAWQPVPGGVVTGNNHVWRQFSFAPVTTSRIRVQVSNGRSSYSRVTEIEAYAVPGPANAPPTVALTSPGDGTSVQSGSSVDLTATATDSDGTISRVDFYANDVLVGTDATGPAFAAVWTPTAAGTYQLTAVATDDGGATTTSAAITVTVEPPPGMVNVALASNGGTASASSEYGAAYPASAVNNGDRRGVGWGSGGGWADGTTDVWPDWVEVAFSSAQPVQEIDVFTVQDNTNHPSEPTPSMTFSKWGIVDFTVQYWTGTAWAAVPGGAVTGNNHIWRQFSFAPVTTTRIRVLVSNGLKGNSRVTEVEAWGAVP